MNKQELVKTLVAFIIPPGHLDRESNQEQKNLIQLYNKHSEDELEQFIAAWKSRKGKIDGLPDGYDTSFIFRFRLEEKCPQCSKLILPEEIENNEILCTLSSLFYHKQCLQLAGITWTHFKPEDPSSHITLNKPKLQTKQQKRGRTKGQKDRTPRKKRESRV